MTNQAPQIVPGPEVPRMEIGAPEPAVLADDDLWVAYRVSESGPPSDGIGYKTVEIATGELWAVLHFRHYTQFKHGYPNDEALGGHPLYSFGLRAYAFQEVLNSPWRAEVAKQNEVHRMNSPSLGLDLRHWIVAFHDEMLEVLSRNPPKVSTSVAPTARDALIAIVNTTKG